MNASESTSYHLARYPEKLAVVKLGPGAEIPAWAESSSVFAVLATATETTLVCAGRNVPTKSKHQKPWTAFLLAGEYPFDASGVLAQVLAPLAEAEIGVFVLSTFDSDWILVDTALAERAEEAWRRSGHTTAPAAPA